MKLENKLDDAHVCLAKWILGHQFSCRCFFDSPDRTPNTCPFWKGICRLFALFGEESTQDCVEETEVSLGAIIYSTPPIAQRMLTRHSELGDDMN